MQIPLSLEKLASLCPFPVYAVGGSVRDFLAGKGTAHTDWDIAFPAEEETFISAAERAGFIVSAVYRNTGTVRLKDENGTEFEATRFRSDKYVRGEHTPSEIEFTTDIFKDARRRDFCANAVYFDVKEKTFVDPLGGMEDIKKGIFRTVAPAKKVFGEDGLRLLRLARLSAETGFLPDEECLAGAKEHRALIHDIYPERIFQELKRLLCVERGEDAYRGLDILRNTRVLNEILPELTKGENMLQRRDFHDHDVLEHSLRCVRYSARDIRFAALLHDVGKPFCFLRDGNFHAHAEEGAVIAQDFLTRLKAPNKLIEDTVKLVRLHMSDVKIEMREWKVRKTIVENYHIFPQLLEVFQADFSACKDNLSPAPTAVKWQGIAEKMKNEGAPFTMKELALNGNDLIEYGIPEKEIGAALKELFYYAVENGARNNRPALYKRLENFKKSL